MAFLHPEHLVETDWLARNLGDPSLRILDCTVFLRRPEGDAGAGRGAWRSESGLAQWYRRKFSHGNSRLRKIGIVALARKLLIAFWRYLETGVVPEGAVLRA